MLGCAVKNAADAQTMLLSFPPIYDINGLLYLVLVFQKAYSPDVYLFRFLCCPPLPIKTFWSDGADPGVLECRAVELLYTLRDLKV